MNGIRAFFGAAGAEPRLVTLYVTLRVAALPAGGGFMAEQLHAAEAMRSLFPDVRTPLPQPYASVPGAASPPSQPATSLPEHRRTRIPAR